jgi:hypothetical protein
MHIETEPLKKYILTNLLRVSPLLEMLSFENVDSFKSIALRWHNLPSAAFRRINGSYTSSEGDTETVWESVYGFGGEIAYDRVFEKVKNTITDFKRLQTDMKLKAMALILADYFINGDHGTDPDGFEGLKKRVAGMPTRQTVGFAGSSSAALDPTASAANANTFFTKLEQMHYSANAGDHDAWIMNEGLKWGLGRVARYLNSSGGNWLTVTKDAFERDIPTLWGSKVIDSGLKRDQTTEIITATETGGNGSANSTSIYAVAFNKEQGITGIQLSPMEIYDPNSGGEDSSTPVKKIRIDWWLGLASFGSYGIVRGWNVESSGNWTA